MSAVLKTLSFDEPPVRLGILASGKGSNFRAIQQAIAENRINAETRVLIYNNPGAGAAHVAEEFDVLAQLCDHRQRSRQDLDREIVEIFKQRQVELVVMAGWMRIASEVLVGAFSHRILNIHPSLLPKFRGLHPVERALAAKVSVSGCTVHWVTPELDAGPIVFQAEVPVLPDDSAVALSARIQQQEHLIYPHAIAIAAAQVRARQFI